MAREVPVELALADLYILVTAGTPLTMVESPGLKIFWEASRSTILGKLLASCSHLAPTELLRTRECEYLMVIKTIGQSFC